METDFPNYYTAAWLVRKGEALRNYYDWTWFQRQMNYAGIEHQLGGYIPQTPLTMLPIVPLAGLPSQTAKRVWLVANIFFLASTLYLLASITRFSKTDLILLALAGYGSLHINLRLGQYYVFLLFLLTLGFHCLYRRRSRSGGVLLGLVFALKLYGGPFVLFFAARRNWKAMAGMLAGAACLGAAAVAIFGSRDIVFFTTQILPRAIAGETLDPYNPGNGTISTLLRSAFMYEPELNPHPLLVAPAFFFFMRPFLSLAIVAIPLLALRGSASHLSKSGFAWFLIALLFASPNTASYTFIVLLLPLSLLLDEAQGWRRLLLLFTYVALTIPMRPSWSWLFPKVWLLLALFVLAGHDSWRRLQWRSTVIATAAITVMAILIGNRGLASFHQEPAQHWQRFAVERGAIYSSSPAVLRSGVIYESIGSDRYILRWQHDNRNERFAFAGQAFRPVALSPEGPVSFELVANGKSTTVFFNPAASPAAGHVSSAGSGRSEFASPDGKWIAFASASSGSTQIFLRKARSPSSIRLTGGDCNSFAAAWELDSKAIIFASDCGRGIGLPALYRAGLSSDLFH